MDERLKAMMNDRRAILVAQAALWLCLGVWLWFGFRADQGNKSAGLIATSIVAVSAGSAYSAVAVFRKARWGWCRWPVIGLGLLAWAVAGHALFVHLGMTQSLAQDIVNVVTISLIALALHSGWKGSAAVRELSLLRRAETMLGHPAGGDDREPGSVAIKVGRRTRLIDPAKVSHIDAEGNFAVLHVPTGPVFASESLKTLAERFERHGFRRVHKSHAVNENLIQERGAGAIWLKGGARIPVGRTYRAALLGE